MKPAPLCVLLLLLGWRPAAGQEPPFEELPTRGSDVSVALRFGTPGLGLEVAKLVRSQVAVWRTHHTRLRTRSRPTV